MGIYSTVNTGVDFDSMEIAESKFTPDIVGAYALVAESEANYNKIMKAVGLAELACLESTGAEIVYEAADGESFIDKIVAFFKSILDKVKSLFKAFIDKMRDAVTNDEKFVAKYEEALKDAKLDEYEGYKFTNLDDFGPDKINTKMLGILKLEYGVDVTYATIANANIATISKFTNPDKSYDEVVAKMRGAISKNGKPVDSKEFTNAIFAYFRNDEDSKVKLTNIDKGAILREIKDSKSLKNKATATYKKIESHINDEISKLNKLKSELKKDKEDVTVNKKMSAISTITSYTKARISALNIICGGYLSALNARRVQNKAICVEMLKNSKSKEAKTEKVGESGFVHTFDDYMSSIVIK